MGDVLRSLRNLPLIAAAIALVAVAGSSGCAPKKPEEVSEISIANNKYEPEVALTHLGSSIAWRNNDSIEHSVTFDASPTPNQLIAPGGKIGYTPGLNGRFAYHCRIHGFKGTIVVE